MFCATWRQVGCFNWTVMLLLMYAVALSRFIVSAWILSVMWTTLSVGPLFPKLKMLTSSREPGRQCKTRIYCLFATSSLARIYLAEPAPRYWIFWCVKTSRDTRNVLHSRQVCWKWTRHWAIAVWVFVSLRVIHFVSMQTCVVIISLQLLPLITSSRVISRIVKRMTPSMMKLYSFYVLGTKR